MLGIPFRTLLVNANALPAISERHPWLLVTSTSIEPWASHKRGNATRHSTTDPEARSYKRVNTPKPKCVT
jgi:hypothetical protein